MKSALLILIALQLVAGGCASQRVTPRVTPHYNTPTATYRTFLEAIKRNDRLTALDCWTTTRPSAQNELELAATMPVTLHRFDALMLARFGGRVGRQKDEACSDQEIDALLVLIKNATFIANGDTARLVIKTSTGSMPPVKSPLLFNEDVLFLHTNHMWKIDGTPKSTTRDADFFDPGQWGWAFREEMRILDDVSDNVEAGRLATAEETKAYLDQKVKDAGRRWEADHRRNVHSEPHSPHSTAEK